MKVNLHQGVTGRCVLRCERPTLCLCERCLSQIKGATGMTSVSDMVNNFLQAEDKNFSLFNFVNELNRYTHNLPACLQLHL